MLAVKSCHVTCFCWLGCKKCWSFCFTCTGNTVATDMLSEHPLLSEPSSVSFYNWMSNAVGNRGSVVQESPATKSGHNSLPTGIAHLQLSSTWFWVGCACVCHFLTESSWGSDLWSTGLNWFQVLLVGLCSNLTNEKMRFKQNWCFLLPHPASKNFAFFLHLELSV